MSLLEKSFRGTRNFLIPLPTLSNQDKELRKEAVLSAQQTCREQDQHRKTRNKLPIPVLLVMTGYTTQQVEGRKMLEEKKEARRAASKKKEKKKLIIQVW